MASPKPKPPPPGQTTTTITETTSLTLPAKTLSYEELNPKSPATDFFGPLGCLFVTLAAPTTAYFLFYGCNESTGCHPQTADAWKDVGRGMLGGWETSSGKWWDWTAAGVYLGWYLFCVVCAIVLPGEELQGTVMRNGQRKTYKMNGGYRDRSSDPITPFLGLVHSHRF